MFPIWKIVIKRIVLDIKPHPYITRTYRGRFTKQALEYEAWKEEVRNLWCWAKDRPRDIHLPPIPFGLKFYIPMPKSWSKAEKLRMIEVRHLQTPDLDNLQKAVVDALFTKKGGGDAHIWKMLEKEKVWGQEGKVVIWW